MGFFKKLLRKLKKVIAPLVGLAVGLATAGAGFGLMAAVAAGAAAAAVTQVGMAMVTSSFDVPDYSQNVADGATAMNQGVLVNKVGTNQPIPVVYGYRRIGGTRVYVSTGGGSDNRDLYFVMVFAEGEINAFKKLLLDDKLVASGTLTSQIDNDAYRKDSRLQYELQTGLDNQNPPSFFTSGASGWTGNHRLRGLAVGYFRCRWINPDPKAEAEAQKTVIDDNPYTGIPQVTVEVEGKKVPNATSYTDTSTTAYASMPKSYSTNPADQLLDYLMNPRYGRGLDHTRIGFTSFKTAKAKFNTTVNYATSGSGKIMELNQVVLTNRTMLQNVQTMLQNMRSGMPYVQGRFNLKLLDTGHASDPTSTPSSSDFTSVTENEIIGGLVVEGKGHRDQYNQVKAVYPDPNNDWELNEVVYPTVDSQTDINLLAEDNGKRLSKEISLEGITNGNIAGDVASIVCLRSRKKKMISFKSTAELHNCVVGDLLKVTYPSLGMTDAQFRITSHQVTADYTIQITAIEHQPTDYDFANVDVYIPRATSQVQSNDSNENGGNTGGSGPVFPSPYKFENAYISIITNINSSVVELTIVGASDVSYYDFMRVDQIDGGENAPFNPSSFHKTTFQKTGGVFTSPQGILVQNSNKPYLWFRIVYIKQDGSEVIGPWKRTTNPKPSLIPTLSIGTP
jgi:hypothetical protein